MAKGEELLQSKYVSLSYNREDSIITFTIFGYVPKEYCREILDDHIKKIEEKNCKYVISDTSQSKVLDPECNNYNLQNVFPRFKKQVKKNAVILSENLFGQLSVQNLKKQAEQQSAPEDDFEVAIFSNLKDARAWLHDKQQD